MTDEKNGWAGGRRAFGDFAPGLVHYTDAVLFDEVWERAGLSKRDRSLVTVAALTALGKTDQLRFHLDFARQNGVTDLELKEAILHLAFYTGWPNGMAAMTVLKTITADGGGEPGFDTVFPRGEKNDAYAQYFIGQSYLAPLADLGMGVSNVTFEPGCRNNWHRHNATSGGGQILLATAGSGWFQAEGQEPVSLEPGMVVEIPAGQKHWHGAKADSWFSHVAIAVPGENTANEWLEPVGDEYYAALHQEHNPGKGTAR